MAAGTESFRYFILGLLTQQPMSGYDIKHFIEGLDCLLGAPSFGAIYPALHTLLEDELVTVEVSLRPNGPLRKLYSITERGRTALQAWVAQSTASSEKLKSFVMHLIMVGDLSGDCLIEHLEQRRQAVVAQYVTLEQIVSGLDEKANVGQRLALEYGLATTTAELNWLDDKLTQLARVRGTRPVPVTN